MFAKVLTPMQSIKTLMNNVQNGQEHFKILAAFAARFLKFV